jgi:hypothetical protein
LRRFVHRGAHHPPNPSRAGRAPWPGSRRRASRRPAPSIGTSTLKTSPSRTPGPGCRTRSRVSTFTAIARRARSARTGVVQCPQAGTSRGPLACRRRRRGGSLTPRSSERGAVDGEREVGLGSRAGPISNVSASARVPAGSRGAQISSRALSWRVPFQSA